MSSFVLCLSKENVNFGLLYQCHTAAAAVQIQWQFCRESSCHALVFCTIVASPAKDCQSRLRILAAAYRIVMGDLVAFGNLCYYTTTKFGHRPCFLLSKV